jgi:class 3 adenylate cyclase
MIACGHDCSTHDHALRMAAAAVDMLAATEEISQQIGSTVQIRIGMHTGMLPCVLCYCQNAANVVCACSAG